MKEKLLLAFLLFVSFIHLPAQGIIITEKKEPGFFPDHFRFGSHIYIRRQK